MKRVLTLLTLLLGGAMGSHAQGVIYTCANTGAWGNGYNETGRPVTMLECDTTAEGSCKRNGGTACKVFHKSNKGGWWGFIAAKDIHGKLYFEVSDGNVSKAAAEADVKKKYTEHGGPYPESTKVQSWFVYSEYKQLPGVKPAARHILK